MPATTALYDHVRLRAWREEAGLDRETVCADLKRQGVSISFSWLVTLEGGTGDRNPSLATLTALARYYGRDLRDLLPGTEAAAS